MELLDDMVCRHLAQGDGGFATIMGSALAATITVILAACLGYF